ncbi:hypothetical protein BHE74_00035152 [Ensete ventricosum]|nr:hypothetical protein BHE74_00035152 [Ensete ventricosum]
MHPSIQVLLEFKEYATEVDVDFVRKAVRAIGRCAIKLERAAERCISVLLELIKIKVNYVVQEAIIVIKDIFRRYPNTSLAFAGTYIDEYSLNQGMQFRSVSHEWQRRRRVAAATAASGGSGSGEWRQRRRAATAVSVAKRSDNSERKPGASGKRPSGASLKRAALRSSEALRPRLASLECLAEKPVISDDSNQLDSSLLDELLANIATLSSVYHKIPDAFVSRAKSATPRPDEDDSADGGEIGYSESPSNAVDGAAAPSSQATVSHAQTRQQAPATTAVFTPSPAVPDLLGDLMGLDNAIVPVDQPIIPSE